MIFQSKSPSPKESPVREVPPAAPSGGEKSNNIKDETEAKAKLTERRRQAKEKAAREAEEERLRQEELR